MEPTYQPVDGHPQPGRLPDGRRRCGCARATRGILAVATAALAALALTASGARAAEVTIVLSSKAGPYVKAEEELRARLVGLGHTTRTIEIGELAKKPEPGRGSGAMFVAVGTPAATWLKANLPAQTPLVYCMTLDAEAPAPATGRKVAGVSTHVPLSVQFGLIAEALPRATTIGLLYRSDNENSARMLADATASLPKSWKLQAIAVDKHESVAKAIGVLLDSGVDVVWTAPDSSVYDVATVRSLLLAAIRSHTPVFGFSPAFVRAGALLGVGIDPAHQGRQAAGIVDLLLKTAAATSSGATTQPRPEQLCPAPEFQLAVNLIVARELSITLPKSLVSRAVHVFDAVDEVKE